MTESDTPKIKIPQYSLQHVTKVFTLPTENVMVLNDVSLEIEKGCQMAIVGASGSGKSTLLHLMGTLDIPTKGVLTIDGQNPAEMADAQKAELRGKKIGFVFQFHYLLPEFSTLENVAMQARIAGCPKDEAMEKAQSALERVGLQGRADFSVTALSGGERQRAAIARAILPKPEILLADEPTGNLDEKNGAAVTELLSELNRSNGITLITVTHNADLAKAMDVCYELRAGALYAKQN